jgi:hypothetical protein
MRGSVVTSPGLGRRVVILAAVALLAMSVIGVSGVSGADTRKAYVGSPPAPVDPPDPTAVGLLTFTPVTAGGATKVDYLVHSYDNQSLTHAFLDLPSTTVPQAAGLTVETVYGANAADCTWVKGGTTVTCDFQKLTPKKPDRSITVVWNVAAAFDTAQTPVFTASLQVNEQTNPNGSNTQVYQADSGTAAVLPANPDAVSTFVPPGLAKKIETNAVGTGNPQATSILLPANANGYVTTVRDDTNQGPTTDCETLPGNKFGKPCVGSLSEAFVNNGMSFAPGYLEWTITLQIRECSAQITTDCWDDKHAGGIVHYIYEGTFDGTTYEVIPFDKQHQCKTSGAQTLPCWKLPTGATEIYDSATETATVVIRTAHNGGSKYY